MRNIKEIEYLKLITNNGNETIRYNGKAYVPIFHNSDIEFVESTDLSIREIALGAKSLEEDIYVDNPTN